MSNEKRERDNLALGEKDPDPAFQVFCVHVGAPGLPGIGPDRLGQNQILVVGNQVQEFPGAALSVDPGIDEFDCPGGSR